MTDQQKTAPSGPIHRLMTIQEILSLFPQKAQRLSHEITNAGLHCIGCHAASWETLEAGMRGHGLPEQSIDSLVAKLNQLLAEEPSQEMASSAVTLTPRAAEKFLLFAQQENKQGYGLRLSDKADGCNGFAHELDFSEKAGPNDEVFLSHGIEIHVEKQRLPRLKGSVIDYMDGLSSSGFDVQNPNAASSCGCGKSHSYSKEKKSGGCCSR